MYIVVEQDSYGQEAGGYTIGSIFGPYGEEEAKALAERLNALDRYATEFTVRQLSLNTGIYQ